VDFPNFVREFYAKLGVFLKMCCKIPGSAFPRENRSNVCLQASYESRRRESERDDPQRSAVEEDHSARSAADQDRQRRVSSEHEDTSPPHPSQPQQHQRSQQRTTSASVYHSAAASRVQPNHRAAKHVDATAPRQRNSAAIRQVLQCSQRLLL